MAPLLTRTPRFSRSPRRRAAPHRRLSLALSTLRATVSAGTRGVRAAVRAPLPLPAQHGVGLNDQQGRAPEARPVGEDALERRGPRAGG